MSDSWLIIVPKDPDWIPASQAQVDAASNILEQAYPSSDGTSSMTSPHYNFVWNGGNFEGVFCPFCGENAEEWWAESIPEASDLGSLDSLAITTPCCSKQTTLNELDYPEPVAFSRFELSIMNPELKSFRDIPVGLLAKLEASLGTPVGVVWRHL